MFVQPHVFRRVSQSNDLMYFITYAGLEGQRRHDPQAHYCFVAVRLSAFTKHQTSDVLNLFNHTRTIRSTNTILLPFFGAFF